MHSEHGMSPEVISGHADANARLERMRAEAAKKNPRQLTRLSVVNERTQLTLKALEQSFQAASAEQIAAHEASVRESSHRTSNEALAKIARRMLKTVPLRPEVHALIAAHCDPYRREKSPLEATLALRAVGSWRQEQIRTVLALIGDRGQGKTTAAGLAAFREVQAGGTVVYVKEPALIAWYRLFKHEEDIKRLLRASLVIIDELGTAEARDVGQAKARVLQVVDDRLARGRTMLLGNLSREQLATRYDERLIDRLAEVGVIVESKGESMRTRAPEAR